MRKTYVLDTNVLIVSPYALLSFEDNEVILSVIVLEELDRLKTERGESGANARQVIRMLESMRREGDLRQGVDTPAGGTIRIELNCDAITLPVGFDPEKHDNRLLRICLHLAQVGQQAILVTNDIVLRIKAQMVGIVAEGFTTEQVPETDSQYSGWREVFAPDKSIHSFFKEGMTPDLVYTESTPAGELVPVPNEFFLIRNDCNLKHTVLGRFNGDVSYRSRH